MAAQHKGRLELTWTDKDKALLSTGDGRYDYTFADPHDPRVIEVRLLQEVERVNVLTPPERPADLPAPTTDNLLVTGDAMHVLETLAKAPEYAARYRGKVKLVYIDPPFNTGQTFTHYEDNIQHSIWLTMLRDRLRQIKPLLRTDGSVWVHLDDVEVHRCRSILDEEFGADNFVAEIAWQKADSPRGDAKGFSAAHDTILVYAKKIPWFANKLPRLETTETRFGSPDGDSISWRDGDPHAPGGETHQSMVYGVQQPISGEIIYPVAGNHWRKSQEWMLQQMQEYAPYELRDLEDADARARVCGIPPERVRTGVKAIMLAVSLEEARNRARARYAAGTWPALYLTGPGGANRIRRKVWRTDSGRVPDTWWPHTEVGHNRSAKNEMKALFPEAHPFSTPKPERLIERILRIGSEPGDIVLDCFAGSGTTAAVAHKMGRRWVTSELLPETADTYTKPRLLRVVQGGDPGGISSNAARVAAEGADLPEGMTPSEAQEFGRLLSKAAKAVPDLDGNSLKALRAATKTRTETVVRWHGGGGFSHLRVGPSMYEVDEDGDVFMSPNAVNGIWSKSVAAQLKFTLTPDHPVFCGVRNRQRLAVIDGVADETVIRTVVEHLGIKERAVVVAKAVLPEAEVLMAEISPGSRLKKAPRDLFPKRTVK